MKNEDEVMQPCMHWWDDGVCGDLPTSTETKFPSVNALAGKRFWLCKKHRLEREKLCEECPPSEDGSYSFTATAGKELIEDAESQRPVTISQLLPEEQEFLLRKERENDEQT